MVYKRDTDGNQPEWGFELVEMTRQRWEHYWKGVLTKHDGLASRAKRVIVLLREDR